jgi:hypothetical protein
MSGRPPHRFVSTAGTRHTPVAGFVFGSASALITVARLILEPFGSDGRPSASE